VAPGLDHHRLYISLPAVLARDGTATHVTYLTIGAAQRDRHPSNLASGRRQQRRQRQPGLPFRSRRTSSCDQQQHSRARSSTLMQTVRSQRRRQPVSRSRLDGRVACTRPFQQPPGPGVQARGAPVPSPTSSAVTVTGWCPPAECAVLHLLPCFHRSFVSLFCALFWSGPLRREPGCQHDRQGDRPPGADYHFATVSSDPRPGVRRLTATCFVANVNANTCQQVELTTAIRSTPFASGFNAPSCALDANGNLFRRPTESATR